MSGTNPVGTWALTIWTGGGAQTPSTYKSNIDANFSVLQRMGDCFAPRPAAVPAMSVVLDAGFIVATSPSGVQTCTEIASQTLTISAAPSSPLNRIDLVVVDSITGAGSVIIGTTATSPVAPPITSGKLQICQVSVPNGATAIGTTNITDLRAVWGGGGAGGSIQWVTSTNSGDHFVLTYSPAITAYTDGLLLSFRASAINTTATPDVNVNALGARTVVKKGGQALLPGDIPGNLAECFIRYNASDARFELINPGVALANIADSQLMANISGGSAVPGGTTFTAFLDHVLGATQGSIIIRSNVGWQIFVPGSAGQAFCTGGSGANPSYQTVSKPGQGVSQFSNDSGYLTAASIAGGYGTLYSYTLVDSSRATSPFWASPGTTQTISGLSGTWETMGVNFADDTVSQGVNNGAFFAQRIA